MGWRARTGHDDYVTSLALCVHAADEAPIYEYMPTVMIPPIRVLYGDESWADLRQAYIEDGGNRNWRWSSGW